MNGGVCQVDNKLDVVGNQSYHYNFCKKKKICKDFPEFQKFISGGQKFSNFNPFLF